MSTPYPLIRIRADVPLIKRAVKRMEQEMAAKAAREARKAIVLVDFQVQEPPAFVPSSHGDESHDAQPSGAQAGESSLS